MGNCVKPCTLRQEEEEDQGIMEGDVNIVKESGKKSGMKVKIVLTKEEVELLLLQLRVNGGKLGDVLRDFDERVKEKCDQGWRPSLESIVEGPDDEEVD